MGLMTGAGCLSRVLGPVFVGVIYTRYGTYWTFGFTSVMMFIAMIWLLLSKNRLIPPSFDSPLTTEMQTLSTNKVPIPTDEAEYKVTSQNDDDSALEEDEENINNALNTALCSDKNNITIVVAGR
ncbi:unnamed protein product [Ceratitis capitata]|uniref:(Mediterranean fruit fly) hypothetical protein n=3 Tax=Ceratitis capitata TaxID=7213 RepID=A0A811V4W2_CERCA|nr:unnamed protein product [Ceratitis capitata]